VDSGRPAGVEGAGGSCRGAGGRWRGLPQKSRMQFDWVKFQ